VKRLCQQNGGGTEQRVDEGRGGGGTEDNEDANKQEENDDGDEPELFVLFEHGQEFGDDAGFFLAGGGEVVGLVFGVAHKSGVRIGGNSV